MSSRRPAKMMAVVLSCLALAPAGWAKETATGDRTTRIVVGERPYTVDEIIKLDAYRLDREAFLREVAWQRSQVDRARALELLAAAEAGQHCDAIERLARELVGFADARARGEASPFDRLRQLQLSLTNATADLAAVEDAWPTARASVAAQRRRADATLQRVTKLRFRVLRDGYLRDDVSLKDLEADQALSFETLFAQAAQVDLDEVSRNEAVREAVVAFDELVYALLNRNMRAFDQWGDRGSFQGEPGQLAKAQVDEALFLMHFLRARFKVLQAPPETEDSSMDYDVGEFEIVRGRSSVLANLESGTDYGPRLLNELQKRRAHVAMLPTVKYLGGSAREIRLWFLDRLLEQAKAENLLRSKGGEAPELKAFLPPEPDRAAVAILQRRPSSGVVDAFKTVLQSIHAVTGRTKAVKKDVQGIPGWSDLVGGVN